MSTPILPLAEELRRQDSSSARKSPQWVSSLYDVGWTVLHHARKHTGAGIVCSVAYFDPGNWGVDLQAGSQYGYKLLFVVLLSGLFAAFLQVLATRLGVVTGLDLASHCRLLFYDRPRHGRIWRWAVLYPLYALSEVAIVSTDLAELLGSAIALNLLFPALPLWGGVLLTSADVLLILALGNPLNGKPVRLFELIIATLVFAVLVCMAIIIGKTTVQWGTAFDGFVPSKEIFADGALYTSVGILGATVMPHSLFLGSHLATQDRVAGAPLKTVSTTTSSAFSFSLRSETRLQQAVRRSLRSFGTYCASLFRAESSNAPALPASHAEKENNSYAFVAAHLYHAMVDIVVCLLGFAVIINSMILILASAVFFYQSGEYGNESPASLFDAHALIQSTIGKGAALLFALALLAAGQSASIVATVAGQSVSEGFLRWKVSPVVRRLITRLLGLIPSMAVAIAVGPSGINTLLVLSQVVLSIVLPFITFPLVWLTSSSTVMRVRKTPLDTDSKPPAVVSSQVTLSQAVSLMTSPQPPLPMHTRTTSLGSTLCELPLSAAESSAPRRAPQTEKQGEQTDFVDYSNGKIMTFIGYLIWLVIVVANVYVIVTLGMGEGS